MDRHHSAFRYVLLAGPASLAMLFCGLPAWTQEAPPWGNQPLQWGNQSPPRASQNQSTPLSSVSIDTKHYPDGARLTGDYDTPNEPLMVPPGSEAARAPAMGLAAAARAKSTLPDGFTILPGMTMHIVPSDAQTNRGANPPGALSAAPSDEKFITVHPLAYKGIPMAKGSDYLTIVGADSRLLVTRNRGIPRSVDATVPAVAADAAVAAARQAAGPAMAGSDAQHSTPATEIWVDNQQAGHLAWTFTLSAGSLTEPDVRRFWVAAAGEPRVLNWESEVFHTQHGSVTGNLWTTSAATGRPTANRSLADLRLTRNTDSAQVITGPDGRYGYITGAGNAQITALLQGPFASVQNQAGAGMQVMRSGGTANPVDLNFGASSESDLAQTTPFFWTNFAHELAQPALGPTALANLTVRTNINATCNAYWDGSSINFFHAGNGCPNTAYSDVVLHEFGHGVDAANGGILDGGYSEGFGDSLAVLGTRQPCVGRDFFGPGTCLRPAPDIVFWPPPPGDEVHDVGRRYAGFVWELVQQLKQSNSDDEAFKLAARLVLGAAAANPANIPDAVRLSFVVDAPDGNPAHGSPHFQALAAAADSRHIPRPADVVAAGGAASASADFPWIPPRAVSSNSVILQATVHMDKPGAVHITANSSAMSLAPLTFQTGFYNDPNPNVVWTNSFRNLAVSAGQWSNFGSTASIHLPAGNNTIYWKIWVTGGTLTLSSGSLLVEAFEGTGSTFEVAGAGESAQTFASETKEVSPAIGRDVSGRAVTQVSSQ